MISKKTTTALIIIGLIFAAGLWYNIEDQTIRQKILLPLALLAIIIPIASYFYIKYSYIRNVEDQFPFFLRDLSEATQAGMTIPRAIHSVSRLDYGILNPEIRRMSDEVALDINLNEVLVRFSKRIRSDVVHRCVQTIIEADKAGGDMPSILGSISEATYQIRDLKHERASKAKQFTISNYVIYLTFIVIIVVLHNMLVPFLSATNQFTFLQSTTTMQDYERLFLELVLINGIFVGLVIGKTAEGSLIAGLKHSFVLTIIGYFIFTIIIAI